MNPECRHLFVYGTLRRGSQHPMARYLDRNAAFVAEARVPGQLYDLGTYPGLTIPMTAGDRVAGDIFELRNVDTILAAIDLYEGSGGHDPLFERCQERAQLTGGETLLVWVYRYRGTVRPNQRILSGEYKPPQPR